LEKGFSGRNDKKSLQRRSFPMQSVSAQQQAHPAHDLASGERIDGVDSDMRSWLPGNVTARPVGVPGWSAPADIGEPIKTGAST
jgi:hypothetical protein